MNWPEDYTDQVICGDALSTLKTLPDASVHCCVTSPPYYGLRDYGTARWEGGDANCEHTISRAGTDANHIGREGQRVSRGERDFCLKCGAHRIDNQLGLEPTPEAYVAHLVEIFREVKRILRPDGCLFLNLGDSYWGGKGKSGYELPHEAEERRVNGETFQTAHNVPGYLDMRPTDGKHPVIKAKDLIGIPWMVAFALRADGWYLRSDIIWHKPNPMPESVRDRPTKAHEYIFLLAKSNRYFYDAEAVKEEQVTTLGDKGHHRFGKLGGKVDATPGKRRKESGEKWNNNGSGRNQRSVWTVATRPFKDAHFATFPEALIEPCIKAGTSERGCCPRCGSQWERVTEQVGERATHGVNKVADKARGRHGATSIYNTALVPIMKTTDWQPICQCESEPIPCTVLDPFFGAGTTGLVAKKLGRHYIGIDLNETYCGIAKKRLGAILL